MNGSPLLDTLKPDWPLLRPPLIDDLRQYSRTKLRADVFAAATVAMVSIPQAVGFALIAGLPPTMVLGCVVVGGLVAAGPWPQRLPSPLNPCAHPGPRTQRLGRFSAICRR